MFRGVLRLTGHMAIVSLSIITFPFRFVFESTK